MYIYKFFKVIFGAGSCRTLSAAAFIFGKSLCH